MKPLCCSFFKSLLWPCLIAAFLVILAVFFPSPVCAQAGPTYDISIDTSDIATGDVLTGSGFITLVLSPNGGDSLPVTTQNNIFYSSDYFVDNADISLVGDANYTPGTPAVATLSTDQGFPPASSEAIPVIFRQQVNILTDFSGPAFAPGPNPPANGSTFDILFNDGDLFPLLTSDPEGRVVEFSISGNGSVTPQTFPQANGAPSVATVTLTPESPSITLFLPVLAAFGLLGMWRARRLLGYRDGRGKSPLEFEERRLERLLQALGGGDRLGEELVEPLLA
jgi:hypothetical protein